MLNESVADLPPIPHVQCATVGCTAVGIHRHHITYHGPDGWILINVCAECHERIHVVHELLRDDGVPLAVVTVRCLLWPIGTLRRAQLAADIEPRPIVTTRQLSFADVMGPEGDYWRRFEDLISPNTRGKVEKDDHAA